MGFLSGLCGVVGSCVLYSGSVSGLASPAAAEHRHYVIAPAAKDVASGDLQFQEFAGQLERALQGQGFARAASADDTDVIILLGYSVSGPMTRTVAGTTQSYEKTGESVVGGTSYVHGNMVVTNVQTKSDYDLVTRPTTSTETTYDRDILITGYAFDAKNPNAPTQQLWRTTVKSTGSSGELRDAVPAMLAMAQPHIARNTGKSLKASVKSTDAAVKQLQGLSAP